jgi:hypothetical protein
MRSARFCLFGVALLLVLELPAKAAEYPVRSEWSNLVQMVRERAEATYTAFDGYAVEPVEVTQRVVVATGALTGSVACVTNGAVVTCWTNYSVGLIESTSTNFAPALSNVAPEYLSASVVQEIDAAIMAMLPRFVDRTAVTNAGGAEAYLQAVASTNWYWVDTDTNGTGDVWIGYPARPSSFPALTASNAWRHAGLPVQRWSYVTYVTNSVETPGWQAGNLIAFAVTTTVTAVTNWYERYGFTLEPTVTVRRVELAQARVEVTNTVVQTNGLVVSTNYQAGFVDQTYPRGTVSNQYAAVYPQIGRATVFFDPGTDAMSNEAPFQVVVSGQGRTNAGDGFFEISGTWTVMVSMATSTVIGVDLRSAPYLSVSWSASSTNKAELPLGASLHLIWSNSWVSWGSPAPGVGVYSNAVAERLAIVRQMKWTAMTPLSWGDFDEFTGYEGAEITWSSNAVPVSYASLSGDYVQEVYIDGIIPTTTVYTSGSTATVCQAVSSLWTMASSSGYNEPPVWSLPASQLECLEELQARESRIVRSWVCDSPPSTYIDDQVIVTNLTFDWDAPTMAVSWPDGIALDLAGLSTSAVADLTVWARVDYGQADPVASMGPNTWVIISNVQNSVSWTVNSYAPVCDQYTTSPPSYRPNVGWSLPVSVTGSISWASSALPAPDLHVKQVGTAKTKAAGVSGAEWDLALVSGAGGGATAWASGVATISAATNLSLSWGPIVSTGVVTCVLDVTTDASAALAVRSEVHAVKVERGQYGSSSVSRRVMRDFSVLIQWTWATE